MCYTIGNHPCLVEASVIIPTVTTPVYNFGLIFLVVITFIRLCTIWVERRYQKRLRKMEEGDPYGNR